MLLAFRVPQVCCRSWCSPLHRHLVGTSRSHYLCQRIEKINHQQHRRTSGKRCSCWALPGGRGVYDIGNLWSLRRNESSQEIKKFRKLFSFLLFTRSVCFLSSIYRRHHIFLCRSRDNLQRWLRSWFQDYFGRLIIQSFGESKSLVLHRKLSMLHKFDKLKILSSRVSCERPLEV